MRICTTCLPVGTSISLEKISGPDWPLGKMPSRFLEADIHIAAVNHRTIHKNGELGGPEVMLANELQMGLFYRYGRIDDKNYCDQQNGDGSIARPERHLAEAKAQRAPA